MAIKFPLTIYYDASCPLCAGEMHALKTHDREDRLLLVDCSAPEFVTPHDGNGVTRAMMMARIHARDATGLWWSGIDVFEAAYRAAGFTRCARIYGSRFLRPLLDRVYPWIADHRQRLSRLGLDRAFWMIAQAGVGRSERAARCASCATATPRVSRRP